MVKVFGIEFVHRRPQGEPFVAKDFAEFTAFAALCHARGVAGCVEEVFFDTKWQGFNIKVAARIEEFSPSGLLIRACADESLPQYELFGVIGGKRSEA